LLAILVGVNCHAGLQAAGAKLGLKPSGTLVPADVNRQLGLCSFSIGNKEAEGQGIKYVGITVAKA